MHKTIKINSKASQKLTEKTYQYKLNEQKDIQWFSETTKEGKAPVFPSIATRAASHTHPLQ